LSDKVEDGHIGALRPDPRNARKHNPKNVGMIERSLNETGAGRSIVVAKDGTILAGNATIEAAGAAGMEDAIFVRTRGDKLIVHVREDLDPDDKRAIALALYDNRATDLSEWDTEALMDLREEFIDDPVFEHIFDDRDMMEIMGVESEERAPSAEPQLGGLEYRVVVDCFGEEDQAELMQQLEAMGRNVKALIS
jgi:hypothetical protein